MHKTPNERQRDFVLVVSHQVWQLTNIDRPEFVAEDL
jgi:hypothetical protein